ncbi:MAG: NAD-dependent epimerase/dehydratase family protein [Lapillicoccus sp.]
MTGVVDVGTAGARPARVVVTGADGFLGWHTRVRLRALGGFDVVPVNRGTLARESLEQAVGDADLVLHLAGLNRASDEDLELGNLDLAERLVRALESSGSRAAVVYADSIQSGSDTPYGRGKRRAGEALQAWGEASGANVTVARLPNLFGEHGRPHYNSFVATFVSSVAAGGTPQVDVDRLVPLLHVQDAVSAMVAAGVAGTEGLLEPSGTPLMVSDVLDKLAGYFAVYRAGDIPALYDEIDLALFNTLRAAMFPAAYPFRPTPRSDERGTLVESVRVHGGQGQTFVSSTHPGFVRGEHFHLRKVERFQVLSGRGVIRLRRMLTDEVVDFEVTGDEPSVVDMPTMWAHSIKNVGTEELVTLFWAHELFDPEAPDTYPEPVMIRPEDAP